MLPLPALVVLPSTPPRKWTGRAIYIVCTFYSYSTMIGIGSPPKLLAQAAARFASCLRHLRHGRSIAVDFGTSPPWAIWRACFRCVSARRPFFLDQFDAIAVWAFLAAKLSHTGPPQLAFLSISRSCSRPLQSRLTAQDVTTPVLAPGSSICRSQRRCDARSRKPPSREKSCSG